MNHLGFENFFLHEKSLLACGLYKLPGAKTETLSPAWSLLIK